MAEVQSKNRALGSQDDQSKATHKMEKKKNLPEQCQGPYHNCFLTERVDKQAQDKARQRLVQKPCFLLL